MSLKDIIKPYGEDIDSGMPDSILSGLYRTILNELGIEESRFSTLLHKYIVRTSKDVSAKEVSSVRSNYYHELLKSVMTWKVFIKGLEVINIKKCDIAIQVWFNEQTKESVSTVRTIELIPQIKDKTKQETDKVLSGIFRDLMYNMKMGPVEFAEHLALYIKRSNVPINQKEIASARGNVKKELTNDRMSWKVFVKGLLFLDISHFTFVVKLHHKRGDITIHKRSIYLEQLPEVK